MTVLLTLFTISLFATIFLLAIKIFELRLGRRIFLPEWLARRDSEIKMWCSDVLESTRGRIETYLYAYVVRYLNLAVWRVEKWITGLWGFRGMRGQKALVKSDHASSYLVEASNGQKESRRKNGYQGKS